jgi:malate synthase
MPKEAKQNIIKDWLKNGQDNGIDVKNVTVSKDIFTSAINGGKLGINFAFGWAKCSIVPDDAKTFAADQIIATASKKAGIVNTIIGVVTCYFETFDESASSEQGIQFMTDMGLIGQDELLENIE